MFGCVLVFLVKITINISGEIPLRNSMCLEMFCYPVSDYSRGKSCREIAAAAAASAGIRRQVDDAADEDKDEDV